MHHGFSQYDALHPRASGYCNLQLGVWLQQALQSLCTLCISL